MIDCMINDGFNGAEQKGDAEKSHPADVLMDGRSGSRE
jgi:hypothetical protein